MDESLANHADSIIVAPEKEQYISGIAAADIISLQQEQEETTEAASAGKEGGGEEDGEKNIVVADAAATDEEEEEEEEEEDDDEDHDEDDDDDEDNEDYDDDDQALSMAAVDTISLPKEEEDEQVPLELGRKTPQWKSKKNLVKHESKGPHARAHLSPDITESQDFNVACAYLKKVKEAYKDNKDVFKSFIKMMLVVRERGVSKGINAELLMKARDVLKDHPDLYSEFMMFLPAQLRQAEEISIHQFDSKRATHFVKMIKAQDKNLYEVFVDLLDGFYKGNDANVQDIYKQIKGLWEFHPVLMEEFAWFLSMDQEKNVNRQSLSKTAKVAVTHGVDGVKVENAQLIYAQNLAGASAKEVFEHNTVRANTPDDLIVTHHQSRLSTVCTVKLLKRFSEFMTLLKKSFDGNGKLTEYIECVVMHSEGIISLEGLHEQVGNLLSPFPKLMRDFLELVRLCEVVETKLLLHDMQGISSQKSRRQTFHENDRVKINREHTKKRKMQSSSIMEKTVDQRQEITVQPLFHPDHIDNEGYLENPSSLFGNKMAKRDCSTMHLSQEICINTSSSGNPLEQATDKERVGLEYNISATSNNEYLEKPLSQLDFSDCKKSTPSYHRIPDDYLLLSAHSQTARQRAMLNDKWISSTSGKEDCSFRDTHKNEQEEVLSQLEDDRFELDMFMEYTTSTIGGLKKMLKAIEDNKDGQLIVNNYISAPHRRVIELLYYDYGIEVLHYLNQSPKQAGSIILKRVEQKYDECSMFSMKLTQ